MRAKVKPMFIRNILPQWMYAPLWGNRDKFGLKVKEQDPCWIEWQSTYLRFYNANQRKGVGTIINDAGYRVMSRSDLYGKTVLEIGPGDIRHVIFWKSQPAKYILADIQEDMLRKGEAKLAETGVVAHTVHMCSGEPLPLTDASVDVVVTFYSMEHIFPLAPYLRELKRVLKPGGILIGAIPAEGGLAWGLGRLVTSRRWFKKNTTIDPDKIICWEHPNFADEIIRDLDQVFDRRHLDYWPLPWLPFLDLNLIIRCVYQNP